MKHNIAALARDKRESDAADNGAPKPRQQKGWRHKDAVALLREMILAGELMPGERLREINISERLGMSRTPVREAFRTLAVEGLVELLPNRSVVVADFDESESMDVFIVLGTLEALAGQLACERITDEQIKKLEQLQVELEHHFRNLDRPSYIRTNREIHKLMVEASRNTSLMLAWQLLLPRAERARSINTLDRRRWVVALEEHRKIFAAVAARDGKALSVLMQDHFAEGVIARIARGKRGPRKPTVKK
ncbi:MAG: GntR family transcriptional regulator [Amphiplicatus sp.]